MTLGVLHAEIATKRKITEARVYVVKGKCGSFLSHKTASELDILKLNVNAIRTPETEITIDQLEQQHPLLFQGIGKLKNFEVKLHVDETVKPTAQPHRRVPFHLQKKVEEELQLLLDQDIIESRWGTDSLDVTHSHSTQAQGPIKSPNLC
jgi:hypothetical protein